MTLQTRSPSRRMTNWSSRLIQFLIIPIIPLGLACSRPDVQPAAGPVQFIEISTHIKGLGQEDQAKFIAQLASKLDVPIISPGPRPNKSWIPFRNLFPSEAPSQTRRQVPIRVLQVNISGREDMFEGAGRGKTYLISTGLGTLLGGLLGSGAALGQVVLWRGSAIGAGAGAILGAVVAPSEFRRCETLRKELGYLPWDFALSWRAIDRNSNNVESVLVTGSETIQIRPFLNHLSGNPPTKDAIRHENLRACIEAAAESLRNKQESLKKGAKVASTRSSP